MNIKNWKPVLILSAVILAVLFCGLSMLRDQQEAEKAKTTTATFDPSTLPDPPDPSIPKERTIEFLGQTYHMYFKNCWSGTKYADYRNADHIITIHRETGEILGFYSMQSEFLDSALSQNDLRIIAQQTATLFTENDLADYTVTEKFMDLQGCTGHNVPDKEYYVYTWIYGSEDTRTVAEESFFIGINATNGEILSVEKMEALVLGYSESTMSYGKYDVCVQISKTVPFLQLPEVSQLEEMFLSMETE